MALGLGGAAEALLVHDAAALGLDLSLIHI